MESPKVGSTHLPSSPTVLTGSESPSALSPARVRITGRFIINNLNALLFKPLPQRMPETVSPCSHRFWHGEMLNRLFAPLSAGAIGAGFSYMFSLSCVLLGDATLPVSGRLVGIGVALAVPAYMSGRYGQQAATSADKLIRDKRVFETPVEPLGKGIFGMGWKVVLPALCATGSALVMAPILPSVLVGGTIGYGGFIATTVFVSLVHTGIALTATHLGTGRNSFNEAFWVSGQAGNNG